MNTNSIFLEIAIWDFCSDQELKSLDKLIQQKYNYYRKCRDSDLLTLPETEAKRISQRVTALEKEVTILYAAKSMIVRMREAYMKATANIGEVDHKERIRLTKEIVYWKTLFMQANEEIIWWVEQARKCAHYGAC